MHNTKPNLFKIATKELSQDAIITWLLQWSNPQLRMENEGLHQCGMALLLLLTGHEAIFRESAVIKVDAGRQWKNIDIWAEIYFANDKKLLLIIEDKVFSGEHNDQLTRYREDAGKWCQEEQFELACAFVKIGSETGRILNEISAKGYNIVDRQALISCLIPFKSIHQTLDDFLEYLQEMQAAHEAFEILPPSKWEDYTWIGFFLFIERNITINIWHRVHNRGGGFWNLCLNWGYWGHFPVYMQIEERKICFKIAVSTDETGLESDADVDAVQDFVYKHLLSYCHQHNENRIQRPARFGYSGSYRTIAIVAQQNWLGHDDQLINKEGVLNNIKHFTSIYDSFMNEIKSISYRMAEIARLPD